MSNDEKDRLLWQADQRGFASMSGYVKYLIDVDAYAIFESERLLINGAKNDERKEDT